MRRLRKGDEFGAETVQLVFAMPVLFILIMCIVQLCIMAFFTLTLSGEAEQTAWAVDLTKMSQGSQEERDGLVKEAILNSAVSIDSQRLSVANSSFKVSTPYSYQNTTTIGNDRNILIDEDTGFAYGLSEMYRETDAGLIEFDVSYKLPSIINMPGLSNMTINRHITRERVLNTRTEIR